MKLKYKFTLILLVASLLIGAGITFTLTSNYMQDKKESIYENHTISALHISEKLGQYLRFLKKEITKGKHELKLNFPEVLAIRGKINFNLQQVQFPLYQPTLKEELKIINGHFLWHINNNSILFKKSFLNKFNALAPSAALAILPMNQNEILSISSQISFPPSHLLEQVLSQQDNQAVVANFSKEGVKDFLTVLAPIPELQNTLLVMQTNQQDISQILLKAFTDIAPFLFIIMIIIIIIAWLFIDKITMSLEDLTEATKQMAQGNWQTVIKTKSKDEVGLLVDAFNQLGEDLATREKELNKVNKKLGQAEKLASLGMFSAGIAHEVKNPLGAILGNAQLIQRKLTSENEDALRYSEVIINESYRATHIIEDLLVFAKERALNLADFSVTDLNIEIKNALTPVLLEKNIILDFKSTLTSLFCDKEQFIQVLQNIILNAIDAFEDVKRIEKLIQVSYQDMDTYNIITIKDNASGIPKEHLSKIFEPFFSSKAIKKGTGLGMAICYGIIQKHQGEISIESELDKGTSFIIKLPKNIKT